VRYAAATRGPYLALSKAWRSCFIKGMSDLILMTYNTPKWVAGSPRKNIKIDAQVFTHQNTCEHYQHE